MKTYEFREVLEHTGVTRNLLARWTAAGIIRPMGGGGKGSRRAWSFRNVVQVAVCDRLRRLGVNETGLRAITTKLELHWDTWPPNYRGDFGFLQSVLWIRMSPHMAMRDDTSIEALAENPLTNSRVPLVTMAHSFEVTGDLNQGYFGIAVNVAQLVIELEDRTGDRLT